MSPNCTRQVRLGTASLMASSNGIFIDPDRIDVKKYATRPALAKVPEGFLSLLRWQEWEDSNDTMLLSFAGSYGLSTLSSTQSAEGFGARGRGDCGGQWVAMRR